MSIQFAAVSPQSFKLGQGQSPRNTPISFCTPMSKTPGVVSMPVNWADYGAIIGAQVLIDVDLTSIGAVQVIKELRSVYIDNSFSDIDVFCFFPDTQFTLVCPANSTLISPVWTNGLKCQLYAQGFTVFVIPSTTFSFSNAPVATAAVVTGQSVVRKSVVNTFVSPIVISASPATFPNCDFGQFHPNATQFIMAMCTAGGFFDIPGPCTINGVAATTVLVSRVQSASNGNAFSVFRCVNNLGGNLANVTVTSGGGNVPRSVAIFSAYNLDLPTSIFNLIGSPAVIPAILTPPAQVLLTPLTGIAIAFGCNGAANGIGFSGIDSSQSVDILASGFCFAYQTINGTPLAILGTGGVNKLNALSAT